MDQGQVTEDAKVLADNSPADPQTTSQLYTQKVFLLIQAGKRGCLAGVPQNFIRMLLVRF